MITIRKKFYAIGQGCFYSERICYQKEVKTIVYDCGSLNEDRLFKEIQQSGLKTIDYLIISHFHKDHINGIDALKKHYNIKNVIIPKCNAIDIAFYLGTNSSIENILLDPNNYFGQSTNVITMSDSEEIVDIDPRERIPKNITHNSNIPIFKIDNQVWVLRFYVDKQVFKKKPSPEQQKLINETLSITDYIKNKKKLTEAYKNIGRKDINHTSMSMLSAPIHYKFFKFHHHYKKYPISIMNGDIMLGSEGQIAAYTDHFSKFKHYTCVFNIPHHGSHKNTLRPINEWLIEKAVIMSGYGNKYGHPSGTVLRKYSDSGIHVKTLTEFDKNICSKYLIYC